MPLLDIFHNRPFAAEVLGLLAAFAVGMAWAWITNRRKDKMKENKEQCCGTCKWHCHPQADDDWVCVNEESDYYVCETGYDDICPDWEGR